MSRTVPHLTHFNTFNTPLTLLNFHKNDAAKMFHVERWKQNVSRGTKGRLTKMFHVEQKGDLLKRFKLNFLHYLTKIIWWFYEKVVSLHRD